MSLTLKQEIEAIYEPLRGETFRGSIDERKTRAVRTGGPRDVVTVDCEEFKVIRLMKTIVDEIERVSEKFKPYDGEEKVWKGITFYNGPQLWVKSLENSYEGDGTTFTVDNFEVVIDLHWYHAIVNITLV